MMDVYVFDKNFNKISNLPKCSFTQYHDELNGLGSFEIQTVYDSDSQNVILEGEYVVFDKKVCGIIKFVQPSRDETQGIVLILRGFLALELLTRRCVPKSTSFYGTRTNMVKKLVNENCINPTVAARRLPITMSSETVPDTASQQFQVTGDSVFNNNTVLLDEAEMGEEILPVLTDVAMSGFKYRVIKGANRNVSNTDGNIPIVLSTDLKNILTGDYQYNSEEYKNVAYVAGEGEGVERTVISMGQTSASGVDRYELYVDARDLQSTDEEGNELTPQQYEATLVSRGSDELGEHKISELYEATIPQINTHYIYGVDFFKGDLVTLEDKALGIKLDARITAVTVTEMAGEVIYDLTFGYQKIGLRTKLKRRGVI